MAWDCETDPEFPTSPEWAHACVREEVGLLDRVWGGPQFTPPDDVRRRAIESLQEEVCCRMALAKHGAYKELEEGDR